jgi:hypothetical protein
LIFTVKTNLTISTEKAFKSIFMSASAIQRLAKNPKKRIMLESFGIDPQNFYPVIAKEISAEEWIRILQFYAKKCEYQLARDILTSLKEIIS